MTGRRMNSNNFVLWVLYRNYSQTWIYRHVPDMTIIQEICGRLAVSCSGIFAFVITQSRDVYTVNQMTFAYRKNKIHEVCVLTDWLGAPGTNQTWGPKWINIQTNEKLPIFLLVRPNMYGLPTSAIAWRTFPLERQKSELQSSRVTTYSQGVV